MYVEDDRDYCVGWKQIQVGGDNENCTRAPEFEHTSATDLKSTPKSGGIGRYGGGGYVFHMEGYIGDVEAKEDILKNSSWINNRTRAVFVEFAAYNAQVYNEKQALCSLMYHVMFFRSICSES